MGKLSKSERELKSDLLEGNLRLLKLVKDKSISNDFRKSASAEVSINIHELQKLRRKESGHEFSPSVQKEMDERFDKAIRSGQLSKWKKCH